MHAEYVLGGATAVYNCYNNVQKERLQSTDSLHYACIYIYIYLTDIYNYPQ